MARRLPAAGGGPPKYIAGPNGGEKLILATPGGLEDFFDDWADGMELEELGMKHNIEFIE